MKKNYNNDQKTLESISVGRLKSQIAQMKLFKYKIKLYLFLV